MNRLNLVFLGISFAISFENHLDESPRVFSNPQESWATKDRRNDPFVIRDGGFLKERTSVTLCWKELVSCPFDNSQSSCCGIMYFRVWQCDDKRRHVIRKIGGKSGVDPHTEPNCPSQPCQRHHRQKCNCLIFFSRVKIITSRFSRFGTPGYMLELIEHEFLKKVAILNELFHLPIGV